MFNLSNRTLIRQSPCFPEVFKDVTFSLPSVYQWLYLAGLLIDQVKLGGKLVFDDNNLVEFDKVFKMSM